MKKQLLLVSLALIGITAFGQITIPNGGFESWTSSTYDYPENYTNNSNSANFLYYNLPYNVLKTTDAHHGTHAIELSTVANGQDTSFGYFINISPDGPPNSWTGGMPYTEKPTGIRGYFKYNVATADSATMIVTFSKLGINIGTYFLRIGGIHNTYTLFNITLNPALTATPDSVSFGALSCKFSPDQEQPRGPAGSVLKLDSISFTGVVNQPAQFNGDFESWQSQTYTLPTIWNIENGNGEGFSRTSDAHEGNYAIELKTYLGNQNGKPAARQGYISNGYYPDNCNGNCQQMGGFPFANQIDTLAFYYKYAPTDGDTANIGLTFKKNGFKFWGTGTHLLASATYKYVEIPFNVGQSPDSIIIDIQSSFWDHQAPSYVGSTLIIDDLHFKTKDKPSGLYGDRLNDGISISPNPSNGLVKIQGLNQKVQSIEVYNETGKKIKSIHIVKQQKSTEINISDYPKGMYFIKICEKGNVSTKKIVVQ